MFDVRGLKFSQVSEAIVPSLLALPSLQEDPSSTLRSIHSIESVSKTNGGNRTMHLTISATSAPYLTIVIVGIAALVI